MIRSGGGTMNKPIQRVLALLGCLLLSAAAVPAREDVVVDETFLEFFQYRSLGPARQGGRILDIIAVEGRPKVFYVAAASGGVWKTENNGTTFKSVLDGYGTLTIGDLAMAPSNPDILWAGTGTPASGRISLLGDGVYKTTDGGKTWAHMGLKETVHIGRIAVHPKNPDIVYVAALGYHFSSNPDRGLYKTVDGGRTWDKVLYISDTIGVVDVAVDPERPDTVFAASYDKWRQPWHFEESGPGSGIYKSMDGGKTWKRLTNGLPAEGKIGRIGFELFRRDSRIIYATVENNNEREPTEQEARLDERRGQTPQKRTINREIYRSDDGGESWAKMNGFSPVIPGGKWYGEIRIDPNDDRVIYVPSVPMMRSTDGGKTWKNIGGGIHVDHHCLWINPADSDHIILGNDGGLVMTYDGGNNWEQFENLPLAQFYAVGVDMETPYNIYGGLQDNGSVRIPSNSLYGVSTGEDWISTGGGDGMYNVVDPEDSRWLYNDYQFGAMQRVDQRTGERTSIQPRREESEAALRWNWTTPILISPHNSRIIYTGAQVVFRSLDRGENWREISPDLTTNDAVKLKGNIEHCTITSLDESSVAPGMLWVGTDDGKVQMTPNGGGMWLDRTPALTAAGAPVDYYVSRVISSKHREGTAYVVKTGFQRDDFTPFVYKTENYGETWTSISGDLPQGTIYVIREDGVNPDLLFVGRDFDVHVTLDGGHHWVRMRNNMPVNPVFDLLIHPRENDLVAATHGRGIYVTDITPLQELTAEVLNKEIFLFRVEPKIQWRYRNRQISGHKPFRVPNEPEGMVINYYLKTKMPGAVEIVITDLSGREISRLRGKNEAGLQRVVWNMRRKPTEEETARMRQRTGGRYAARGVPVSPGEVMILLKVGDQELSTRAEVRPMPDMGRIK